MKRTTILEYATPSVEVCSVEAEKGYSASLNTGIIDDAKTEDWGTL
jgi:hypothetical protein